MSQLVSLFTMSQIVRDLIGQSKFKSLSELKQPPYV